MVLFQVLRGSDFWWLVPVNSFAFWWFCLWSSGFVRWVSRSLVLDLGSGLWCCWVEGLVLFVAVAGLSGSGFRSSSGFLIVVPVDIFEFLLRKKRLGEL